MPTIIKPMRLGILTKTQQWSSASYMVVSVIGHFKLDGGTDFELDQALWPVVGKQVPAPGVFDMAMPKPFGEVLVGGFAVAPGNHPVQALRAGFRLGPVTKEIAVFGDRYWQLSRDGYVFTAPAPFIEIPLGSDRSFGGTDFAANPAGTGHGARKRVDAGDAVKLPNLEHPTRLIRDIEEQPPTVRLWPMDPASPDRRAFAGTYDDHWLKHDHPGLPRDADPRLFMVAPPDQWIDGYFHGDEPYHLVGMSAAPSQIQGTLPGLKARAFARMRDAETLSEINLKLDTVWLFGSAGIGVVIFRGMLPITDVDGADIAHLMLAYERMGEEPRTLGHYADVFKLRTDKETAANHVLADEQLAPRPSPETRAARQHARDLYNAEVLDLSRQANDLSRRLALEEAGIPADALPPAPPIEPLPYQLPTPDDIRRGDIDFAGILEGVETLKASLEARVKQEAGDLADLDPAALSRFKKTGDMSAFAPVLAAKGIDLADLVGDMKASISSIEAEAAARPGGAEVDDPDFETLMARVGRLIGEDGDEAPAVDIEAQLQAATERFLDAPEASMLKDIQPAIDQARITLRETYDLLPDGHPAADPVDLDRLLDEIAASHPGGPEQGAIQPDAARVSLDGAAKGMGFDDASGIDAFERLIAAATAAGGPVTSLEDGEQRLDVATQQVADGEVRLKQMMGDLRRKLPQAAFPMEPMPVEASQRFGAFVLEQLAIGVDLRGRDMAGIDLTGKSLAGLDLSDAQFERADLTGTDLQGVIAPKAVFTEAQLSRANLAGSRLDQANLGGAMLTDADLSHCSLVEATLIGVQGERTGFQAAEFRDNTIVTASLAGANFARAHLSGVSFLQSDLTGSIWDGAELDRCVFIDVQLGAARFQGARFHRCVFLQTPLIGSDFRFAHMRETSFIGPIDMTGVRFDESDAEGITLQKISLDGGRFYRARFDRATMQDCELASADFRYASMKRAMLGSSRLPGAQFIGANLREAQLRRTDLSGASFRHANLTACDLSDATLLAADFTAANLANTIFGMPADAA